MIAIVWHFGWSKLERKWKDQWLPGVSGKGFGTACLATDSLVLTSETGRSSTFLFYINWDVEWTPKSHLRTMRKNGLLKIKNKIPSSDTVWKIRCAGFLNSTERWKRIQAGEWWGHITKCTLYLSASKISMLGKWWREGEMGCKVTD